MRKYERLSGEEWRSLLSAYASSGESQQSFCRRHGLSLSTFQLKKRAYETRAESPFEEIGVLSSSELEVATLHFSHCRVEVPGSLLSTVLRELASIEEESRC